MMPNFGLRPKSNQTQSEQSGLKPNNRNAFRWAIFINPFKLRL